MRSLHLLIAAALAFCWLSGPATARGLTDALYCCSVTRPCWGWGPQQGRCCSTPDNGGCAGARRCSGGLTPDSFNAQCSAGTGAAASASDSAGSSASQQTPSQQSAAAATSTAAITAELAAAYPTATPEQLAQLAAQVALQDAINAGAAQAQPAAAAQVQPAATAVGAAAQQAAGRTSASSGGTWTNIKINRFGDYTNFGQGQGWMGTVACTGRIPPPAGEWTAMNFQAFGLPSLPCGMGLTVTNPATGASVRVTVVDGGGSDGLDLDNAAYAVLVPPGTDGIVGGITVTAG